MTVPRLHLTPVSEGYSATDQSPILRTQLDGGAGLFRVGIKNGVFVAEVEFNLDADGYHYWRAFYRTKLLKGSLPFYLNLVLVDKLPTKHKCNIVPGSVKLTSLNGTKFVVQCQLEAEQAISA